MPKLTQLITHWLRFPQGELVPADGTSHQWLPIGRPDVIIAAVRDVLALNAAAQKTSTAD